MKKKKIEKTVLQKLIDDGYSSFEVCFTAKLKRNGIMKWLEDKKLIKEKSTGFAIEVGSLEDIFYISDSGKSIC